MESLYLYSFIAIILINLIFYKQIHGKNSIKDLNQSLKRANYIRIIKFTSIFLFIILLIFYISNSPLLNYNNLSDDIKFSIILILLLLFLIISFYLILNFDKLSKHTPGLEFIINRKDFPKEEILFEYQYEIMDSFAGINKSLGKLIMPKINPKITFLESGFIRDIHPDNSTIEYYKWKYFQSYQDNTSSFMKEAYNDKCIVLFKNKKYYNIFGKSEKDRVILYLDYNYKENILKLISEHLPKENY